MAHKFSKGDRVNYHRQDDDQWVTGTIVGQPSKRHGLTVYGIRVDDHYEGSLSKWGYENQFTLIKEN